MPNSNSVYHTTLRLVLTMNPFRQEPLNPQQQSSFSIYTRERTTSILFTELIGQRHMATLSGSCQLKLDSEMLSSRSGIYLKFSTWNHHKNPNLSSWKFRPAIINILTCYQGNLDLSSWKSRPFIIKSRSFIIYLDLS